MSSEEAVGKGESIGVGSLTLEEGDLPNWKNYEVKDVPIPNDDEIVAQANEKYSVAALLQAMKNS